MLYKKIVFIFTLFCFSTISFSQPLALDSGKYIYTVTDTIKPKAKEKEYSVDCGKIFIYQKPKLFSFLTKLPKDAAGIATATFKRKSIKPLLLIAGTTALLMLNDEYISKRVSSFSNTIHLRPEEGYKDIFSIKAGNTSISLLKAPQNINTALYQFGQGFPSLLIAGGLFIYGKIHNNYRAISTASQLTEVFISMGVGTQLLKRITGRQSPSETTDLDGHWHPFPSFKKFQNHTPAYDAFPSGHLATLISTVTVLADNYPEIKWIKPAGYSVIVLVGYSMINNRVHWASDYPLALALGYLCAKQVVKNNRRVAETSSREHKKATLSYTVNYVNGRIMPGVVCKF